MHPVNADSFKMYRVWPWLFMRLPKLKFPKAVYTYERASKARNSGAALYVVPNNVETAGSAKHATNAATGTTSNDAYLTENWKTFLMVSLSF